MKVLSILGGRPHLVKAESVHRAFASARDVEHSLVEFWLGDYSDYPRRGDDDFDLPRLDRLRRPTIDGLRHEIAKALRRLSPDMVLLYGDLPTTEAATTVCQDLAVPFVHIESGYRSGDSSDAEEKVRVKASREASHRIAFSDNMRSNLVWEGIDPSTISVFGNAALQTMDRRLYAMMTPIEPAAGGLVTFHRDENLSPERLETIYKKLERLSHDCALRIILYKRTRQRLAKVRLLASFEELAQDLPRVEILPTLTYDRYLCQLLRASFVLTDSSTVQDECAFLAKPCLVMREFTPRNGDLGPATQLVGNLEAVDLLDKVTSITSASASATATATADGRRERLGIPYDHRFISLLRTLM